MSQTTQFTIGTEASCSDGVCGEVTRVVVDPVAETLTHLVVEPKHHQGAGRLVPLELLDTATSEVRLRCTLADFDRLDAADETHFLPGNRGYGGYGRGQALFLPYYGLGGGMAMGVGAGMGTGMGAGGLGLGITGGMGQGNFDQSITTDVVPSGEVSVHRGDRVIAVDGEIGRVQGLVIARRDHQVTHVLLQEGHLFGRKDVAIPISAVTTVDEGIQLNISKQQVKDLPAIDIDHPDA
ncbi:MAG: PRC-barrel domain-containing protein [Jatrophihabitans sp.]